MGHALDTKRVLGWKFYRMVSLCEVPTKPIDNEKYIIIFPNTYCTRQRLVGWYPLGIVEFADCRSKSPKYHRRQWGIWTYEWWTNIHGAWLHLDWVLFVVAVTILALLQVLSLWWLGSGQTMVTSLGLTQRATFAIRNELTLHHNCGRDKYLYLNCRM